MSPEMQHRFIEALYADHSALEKDLDTSNLSAEKQLSIYRDSMYASLLNSLTETFCACKKLLGEQCFAGLASQYAKTNASRNSDLCNYGESFPGFIQSISALESISYLHDIALFEWHWKTVFYAANESIGNLMELEAVDENQFSQIKFCLPVASAVLSSDYPVEKIWEINVRDDPSDTHIMELNKIIESREITYLFIGRQGVEMQVLLLEQPQFVLLSIFQKGFRLEQVLDEFSSSCPEEDFQRNLSELCAIGAIHRFEVKP